MSETTPGGKKFKRPQHVYDLTDDFNKSMGIEPVDEVIDCIEALADERKAREAKYRPHAGNKAIEGKGGTK